MKKIKIPEFKLEFKIITINLPEFTISRDTMCTYIHIIRVQLLLR